MRAAIYLINPNPGVASYFGAEVVEGLGMAPATMGADLALPTVAALIPPDFQVELCDEHISRVDLEHPAPFIGITGKVSQFIRMKQLARAFRERGKTVIFGGPHATLAPTVVRPHCDILVRGEIEDIAGELFSDLRSGCWRDEYHGGKPDLANSPVPRWELYPHDRILTGTVQTSRGCPFTCEFCDVIQYVGRKQRHKPVDQVLAELDVLYRLGYRSVFLSDDNFTVYRSRAKELLVALRDWNVKQTCGRVTFNTQVSIDAARDTEMLRLCAEAGMKSVFVGIETTNEEALRETRKKQNLLLDAGHGIQRFLDHGIAVAAGMIVGFDADRPDIFRRQYEFAMETAVPIFSAFALGAPLATPLHARLAAEGRLVPEAEDRPAQPWHSNIIPSRMSREQLTGGLKHLCNRLYHPLAFEERVTRFVRDLGSVREGQLGAFKSASVSSHRSPAATQLPPRSAYEDFGHVVCSVSGLGPEEAAMVRRLERLAHGRPGIGSYLRSTLFRYRQIRFMFEEGRLWDPSLATTHFAQDEAGVCPRTAAPPA